jgi:hypothetical protein
LFDQELCEFRIIAGRLATDADLATLCARDADDLRDHLFHGRIPLIENRRDDLAVAIHAEDQLHEVVRADRESVKDLANSSARSTLLGISHIT